MEKGPFQDSKIQIDFIAWNNRTKEIGSGRTVQRTSLPLFAI